MSSQRPLVLVHGIDDTAHVFRRMEAYLRDRGWASIYTLNLHPNNGDRGLDQLAQQLQAYVDQQLPGNLQFDLLGFSMGGLVSRYYVQRLQGSERVRRFVTVASPHNGTWTGYLRQNPGARQMRPHSSFLQDLNRTVHELQQVAFTSLWTPYDLMIVPARSSQLPVGEMRQVPVLAHPWMLTDPRSLAAIAAILSAPTPPPATQA